MGTIGQDAPAELAGGHVVHTAQIAQHLRRGGGFLATSSRTAIERPKPPFGLDNGKAVLITPPVLVKTVGTIRGGIVGEQQSVRHVFPAARREILLAETCRPAEACQHRPDQIVLGLALVGRADGREAREYLPQARLKPVKQLVADGWPVGCLDDGIAQKIFSEKTSLEWSGAVHGSTTPSRCNALRVRREQCSVGLAVRCSGAAPRLSIPFTQPPVSRPCPECGSGSGDGGWPLRSLCRPERGRTGPEG